MDNAQVILITGMPFSGKSYVADYLIKQDVNAVDADKIKGLGKWHDKDGNVVSFPEDANQEWLDAHTFLWDVNVLQAWLKEQTSTVYLFGLSANVLDVSDLFDCAYYLDLTPEVLTERFSNNERENPMGKMEEQQQAILKSLADFAKQAKEKGFTFIPADLPPEKIFKIISKPSET